MTAAIAAIFFSGRREAAALSTSGIPPAIATPDKVETRSGTLEFKDGAPSKATLDKIYDDLDFTHAQRTFADTFQAVSIHAIRKGLQSVGVKASEVFHARAGSHEALATSPANQTR